MNVVRGSLGHQTTRPPRACLNGHCGNDIHNTAYRKGLTDLQADRPTDSWRDKQAGSVYQKANKHHMQE